MFDFSVLSHLWETSVESPEIEDYLTKNPSRAASLHGIGACMAGLHDENIIVDAHEENFGFMPDGTPLYIDRNGAQRYKEGEILPIMQRAENLAQIMLGLSPVEWMIFRHGYVSQGWNSAAVTIDLIEGRGFPWRPLMADERYDEAISMIQADIQDGVDPSENIGHYADLGACYTGAGQPVQALEAYRRAIDGLTAIHDSGGGLLVLKYNAMKAAFRIGEKESVIEFSRSIISAAGEGILVGNRSMVSDAQYCLDQVTAPDYDAVDPTIQSEEGSAEHTHQPPRQKPE
jgi:tetratricopeptide (TPR) repeat protein